MTAVLTSATGILSLLDEPEEEIQAHALGELDKLVDHFWSEIAPAVPKIEELYEDEDFKSRSLAAVVASKVFYHLEELDDSLRYALGAGNLFDIEESSEYVQTLIAKSIDDYVRIRTEAFDAKEEPSVDERLEAIVNKMFDRCYADGKYQQALGIAVESRRLDIIKKSILTSDNIPEMLEYGFALCSRVILQREFRLTVLGVLVDIYKSLDVPDYINMCQCWLFLDDHASVADVLQGLVEKDPLMAYQVGFDLYENQNQPFLVRVLGALPATEPAAVEEKEETPDDIPGRLRKLKAILNGETPINLYLHFLYGHNRTDLNILKQIKDKLEARNSVTHNATVMAHAIMHAGTTVDVFLRENLEWLGRATNWAKFTATASIGVIHKGHHKRSLALLEPYLPKDGQATGTGYQEGGALYALGLIHVSDPGERGQYLLEALRNAGTNEIVQHGACLGLGLCAMATQNMTYYDEVKSIVFTESAIAGQAAGLAMGLVLLGSGNGEALEEMLKYAHETQHERIIRGLAMGMALIVYGREEEADTLIEQMLRDKDPILRHGGLYAVAMAYVATANNGAIRKLLHVAVSDVSDDVRRSAVTALGFVLCRNPEQVPRLVSLLAESYNPHVRYGACLAVGIACASSGMPEAMAMLEPLLKDRVDFVRQGAFIAMSMVLVQHNEALEPKVKSFRKAIMDSVSSKGDTMTKLGAILGAGILDAGGRNMTISLVSAAGHKMPAAIVGMAIFPQFWYWYPEAHFLSLSFSPTAVIGLNQNLKMPKPFTFTSAARPSLFAYPEPIKIQTEEAKKITKKNTLSVAKKAARAKKKDALDSSMTSTASSMDLGDDAEGKPGDEADQAKQDKADADEKKRKEPEPEFEVLQNPHRVTAKQRALVSFEPTSESRYIPVKSRITGIVMLRDRKEGEEEDLHVPKAPKIGQPGVSDDEPAPPEPFEFLR